MGTVSVRRLALAAVLAVLALAFVVHAHRHHRAFVTPGKALDPIALTALDGSSARLPAPGSRGEVVNVFATWCEPCRAEMPGLAAASRDWLRTGIAVAGVDQQEPPATVQSFARWFGLPYSLYVDEAGATHTQLGIRMIPTTIYIDARGIVRFVHSGPLSESELKQDVQRASSPSLAAGDV